MLTTPHLLIGMYLVSKMPSLGLGLLAAFLSHFLFDFCFPHWNPHLYTEKNKGGKISKESIKVIIGDALVGGMLSIFVLYPFLAQNDWKNAFFLALGGFLAIIPDIVEIPYYFLKSQNPILKKYIQFEHDHQLNTSPFWGVLSQVLVIILAFYLLIK